MWILISIASIIILLAAVFLIIYSKNKNKGKSQEPDYYMFFVLGIVWTGTGVALATTNNFGILAMGIIFLILGLVNKDKWKTNHKTYKDLTPKQKKIKLWILAILGILILALFLFWFLY